MRQEEFSPFPWLLRRWSDGEQKSEIDPEIGGVGDKWRSCVEILKQIQLCILKPYYSFLAREGGGNHWNCENILTGTRPLTQGGTLAMQRWATNFVQNIFKYVWISMFSIFIFDVSQITCIHIRQKRRSEYYSYLYSVFKTTTNWIRIWSIWHKLSYLVIS